MSGLPLVGDEFAGYRVRSVLGRGGMSVVYQAENLRLSSVIALKVLAPELASDDVFRARFLEESRIAASLNHPNVIPIYDMGSQDGLLYIAMRYVSGTDMRQMIKKRGRILPATALFLVGQAARALDAAHRKGLVHRDVKPGNLLIERGSDDADPDHVYLADFGITKHAMSRSGLTSTGQFLGTIDYVAPEQIRGTSVLGLADQYSLGCVLYECLTGRVPFEKDLDAAIIWAHVEETPTMPTVLRPELPPEIDEVFGRVLAKRPDERYSSCREFVEAARMALGIFGSATDSSLAYGTMTAGPQAGAPPGSQPGAPGRFSWSNVASPAHAADPVAPGSVAAAAASGPGQPWADPQASSQAGYSQPGSGRPDQQGGTLTSHRREYGSGGPGQPAAPAAAGPAAGAALVPLAALAGAAGRPDPGRGGAGHLGRAERLELAQGQHDHAVHVRQDEAEEGRAERADERAQADEHDSNPKGLLPPSTCTQQGSNMVTCTAPSPGITEVEFHTYPSLTALYNAYMAEVMSHSSSSQFKQNYKDCGLEQTVGEVGWNHQFQHPKTYTVAQMTAGKVTDDQAVGRVFCNFSQGLEYMIWTQGDGHVMGIVVGAPHEAVWKWWVAIHHNIPLGGVSMNMNMTPSASPSMSSMPSSTSSMPSSTSSMSPSPSPSASMSSMRG